MKITTFTAISTLCLSSTFAQAGGLAPTVEDTVVIVQEPQGSAAAVIVPLLVLGLLAAASGASGTNSDAESEFRE